MASPTFDGRPIFLVGLMGSGKSTVGPLLAARLNRRFVDLDARIAHEANATIEQIFRREGEASFRAREARALAQVAEEGAQVVAVGGGTPCYGSNMERMLEAGAVVWLTASITALTKRVGSGRGRPLLAGKDVRQELERLHTERSQVYARAHWVVDTSSLSLTEVALKAAEALAQWR